MNANELLYYLPMSRLYMGLSITSMPPVFDWKQLAHTSISINSRPLAANTLKGEA